MVELEISLGGFPTTKQEPIKGEDKKSILVREREMEEVINRGREASVELFLDGSASRIGHSSSIKDD